MRAATLLSPTKWAGWIGELRGFLEARRHPTGFIAIRSGDGVQYNLLPERVWPTKSFEFWTFLAGLLQCVRPESILEIGSGRSTIYLSEYAHKHGKILVSIEQSAAWASLNNAVARFGNIEGSYVKHLPLGDDGFFEPESLDQVMPPSPDFAFLDGPNGPRDSARQSELYRKLAQTARIVILDDLQLPTVYRHIDLFRTTGMERGAVFFRYPVKSHFDNYLAVLFEPSVQPVVKRLVSCLDVEALDSVTHDICVDKKTGAPVTPVAEGS